jgi:protein phosphatase
VSTERVIKIPPLAMILLIGASGSGKSTFAASHFQPTEILSSDSYRAVVSDDASDQSATTAAFDVLRYIAEWRLKLGKLVVIDATNVKSQDRAGFIKLAREQNVQVFAVVLNLNERVCAERNSNRPDRNFGAHVIRNHIASLRRDLRNLEKEGISHVTILHTPEEVNNVQFKRVPLNIDRRTDSGPFDIVGDVHGCYDELVALLYMLGYHADDTDGMSHPEQRQVIFLGDLVDRGPKIIETVNLVYRMVTTNHALCVPGNHDIKLARYLAGHNVQISHGLDQSIAQIEVLPEQERTEWVKRYQDLIKAMPSHYLLDQGKLAVAHAGMKEDYQGRNSRRVYDFALFGETTGETDEIGLPIRGNWAKDYRGKATVVYGHTAIDESTWLNNTIDIDTGCVYGGKLTALRWPERELVSMPAQRMYAEPKRVPARMQDSIDSSLPDTLLRLEDVQGKQIIPTSLLGNVIIEAERAAAALGVMSRFAVDPRWLIYLPPTMSPSETALEEGYLEYPKQALDYYKQQGITKVVCEEKHMGSRAVIVLCRDEATVYRRFGIPANGLTGMCYTRTGRRFFDDDALDAAFITRLITTMNTADIWERYKTDWICIDAEILPWNVKAQGLLREQYAPVGTAGMASVTAALKITEQALQRGVDVTELHAHLHQQQDALEKYIAAYRRYCWNWDNLSGVHIAPFHLLATEGKTYLDRDHVWHMTELSRFAQIDPLFLATNYKIVDLANDDAIQDICRWWQEQTDNGAEGMVVKPYEFIPRQKGRLLQPALKCRGREYLRIIYGPDYLLPENLQRLRTRNLKTKRNVALREFALGVEALSRFVQHEPLWRVHQPVFGVLAMESEPIDPRL